MTDETKNEFRIRMFGPSNALPTSCTAGDILRIHKLKVHQHSFQFIVKEINKLYWVTFLLPLLFLDITLSRSPSSWNLSLASRMYNQFNRVFSFFTKELWFVNDNLILLLWCYSVGILCYFQSSPTGWSHLCFVDECRKSSSWRVRYKTVHSRFWIFEMQNFSNSSHSLAQCSRAAFVVAGNWSSQHLSSTQTSKPTTLAFFDFWGYVFTTSLSLTYTHTHADKQSSKLYSLIILHRDWKW